VTAAQGNGGSSSSSRKELLLRADPAETLMCRRLSPGANVVIFETIFTGKIGENNRYFDSNYSC
jgi:hypothetical protein